MSELSSYKSEIPELKSIKNKLKRRCYDSKKHLQNIRSGMLGSDGLAVRESLIDDIKSLKEKVKSLEEELEELSNRV